MASTRSKNKKTPAKKDRPNAAVAGISTTPTNQETEVQAPASMENVRPTHTADMIEGVVQAEATDVNLASAVSVTDGSVEDNTASGGDEHGGDQVVQERVFVTEAEETNRLNTKGRVVAIYDSVWTMEDNNTIKVYPGYQGETVCFRAISSGRRSNSELTYKAIYSAGPYKAVYSKSSRINILWVELQADMDRLREGYGLQHLPQLHSRLRQQRHGRRLRR